MRPNFHNFNIDNLRELFAAPLAHSQEADLIEGLLAALDKAISHAQYLAHAINPNKEKCITDLHSYLAQQLPALASDCSLQAEDLAPAKPLTMGELEQAYPADFQNPTDGRGN